jgi:hypothetical protein
MRRFVGYAQRTLLETRVWEKKQYLLALLYQSQYAASDAMAYPELRLSIGCFPDKPSRRVFPLAAPTAKPAGFFSFCIRLPFWHNRSWGASFLFRRRYKTP